MFDLGNISLQHIAYITQGIWMTMLCLVVGLIGGFFLGILMAVGHYNKYLRYIMRAYVTVIRGTPTLLQVLLVYFALPKLTGVDLGVYGSAFLAFAVNSSAYVCEVVRAGMNGVPVGQWNAARVLRIPKFSMWIDIILPQVVRNAWPALINEAVLLLKETSLVSVIGGAEITRRAQIVGADTYDYLIPLLYTGCLYLCMSITLQCLGDVVRKRFLSNNKKDITYQKITEELSEVASMHKL